MTSIIKKIFGKSVINIDVFAEQTREGINKGYIPKFLYKPPFGYPRYANVSYIRYLAQTPFVEMCITTIIDEMCSIPWDIIPTDGMEDESDESEIEHIRNLFVNPNTNKESFEDVFIKMPVRDLLEINTGLLNKVFNLKEELVEIVARDGATFTKNPDIHGMYTDRDDILIPKVIVNNPSEVINPFQQIPIYLVTQKAAFFQYGWIAGPVPVPFGKREIIWLDKQKRTDEHYGYSPVQILAKNLQTLIYMIESDLEYFNDNNVPKGIIGLEDSETEEIEAFKEQWFEQQRKKDEFGNWKKLIHKVPIVNRVPKFERIEFTSEEIQMIEKQKWWTKMVWASFGVTATELGYTEDAQGQSNQIVQSKVFRKKAINPILRLLENRYNADIVSEFNYWGFIKTKKGKQIKVPKYKFVFKVFDVDEERNKAELFKLQAEAGFKTINEIRKDEGLEEVEWGNDPPNKWSSGGGSTFNIGGEQGYNKKEENAQKPEEIIKTPTPEEKPKIPKENKDIECKPGMGHSDEWWEMYHALIKEGHSKESAAKIANSKLEGKSNYLDNPLIIKENEMPYSADRLEKGITYILKQIEEETKKMIEDNVKENKLSEIKDLNAIIAKVMQLFSFNGLKGLVNTIVKNNYLKGWDKSEKELDKNFVPEAHAMDYLSNYTFDNIKGMSTDIANKLRQELQRGYMNGEGVDKLKERVKSVFDVGDNRAEMIARTETNRASNTGKLQAYQKSGEKVNKVWVTHYDDRTSALCKRLDGQEVGLNEMFKDPHGEWEGMSPPSHVNCRSTIIFKPIEES